MSLTVLPIVVCASAVPFLLVAEFQQRPRYKACAKLTASSAFIWYALINGALNSTFGGLILLALALCWCGDMLLLPPGRSRFFLFGIAAFLVAHVVYGIAFYVAGVEVRALGVAALVLMVAGAVIVRWLLPHLEPRLKVPVLSYVVVLLGMVAVAAGARGAGAPIAMLVGAAGFALSDVAVARDRFVHKSITNRLWGLPAYYASQLLLASLPGA